MVSRADKKRGKQDLCSMRMISSHFDNETVMIIAVPEPEYRKSETIPGRAFC